MEKFAAQGKRIRKKDRCKILRRAKRLLRRRAATTYGYIYVAQIAMGADHAQTLKAISEAEAWHDSSIIIAYAPGINHGLKAKSGMGKSQAEELFVEAQRMAQLRYKTYVRKQAEEWR